LKKDIWTRTLWGIMFVIVLTGAILSGPYTCALLFLVLSVFILREFYSLTVQLGYSPQVVPGLLTGGIIFILCFLCASGTIVPKSLFSFLVVLFLFPVWELFRKTNTHVANVAVTGFGILYVSVPLSILNFIVFPGTGVNPSYDYTILISLFIFLWANDSGAYLFGISFGRHRLFERISPKKSWEGVFGGLITAIAAAWILSITFPQHSFKHMALIASITVVAATLGDLVESMIKRSVGVKDSGRFMPGHGGLLDRFDSLLLASPVIFFVIQFLPSK
jgi:phosphatidate cytidylyltransferase